MPLQYNIYAKNIQQRLNEDFDAGLKEDGLLGPKTEDAFLSHLREPDERSPDKPNRWPRMRDIRSFFGDPCVGTNLTTVQFPYPMRLSWDLDNIVTKTTCHKKVADSIHRVLRGVLDYYGMERIQKLRLDRFGGCYNCRKMRGGSTPSTHSWGVALDFDPERNRLRWGRDKAAFAQPEYDEWWQLWEDEGWVSLGRERNFDWMHIQAVRL